MTWRATGTSPRHIGWPAVNSRSCLASCCRWAWFRTIPRGRSWTAGWRTASRPPQRGAFPGGLSRATPSPSADSSRVLERPLRQYDAVRGRAYLALAQRDTDAALRSFEALPDSLCGGCREAVPWSHLTRAELLMARNRAADAARLLAPGVPWWPRPLSVLTALARARAADRAGDRGQAIWDYRFVAATWAHADVELQPVVAEAQAALARLAGSRLR